MRTLVVDPGLPVIVNHKSNSTKAQGPMRRLAAMPMDIYNLWSRGLLGLSPGSASLTHSVTVTSLCQTHTVTLTVTVRVRLTLTVTD